MDFMDHTIISLDRRFTDPIKGVLLIKEVSTTQMKDQRNIGGLVDFEQMI